MPSARQASEIVQQPTIQSYIILMDQVVVAARAATAAKKLDKE